MTIEPTSVERCSSDYYGDDDAPEIELIRRTVPEGFIDPKLLVRNGVGTPH
jgi:hypothetical protein